MARKHCRTRVRTRRKRVLVAETQQVKHFAFSQLPELKWPEWIYRTITTRKGWQLVGDGEAEAVHRQVDGVVQLVGFRATKPTRWERPSATTLTDYTLTAVGTAAMGGALTRSEHREVEKFAVWALIGDTRAACVRPRLSGPERAYAESVLRQGGMRAA